MASDDATFSPCTRYRYTLRRHLNDESGGVVVFIMLNPSVADAVKNDPTVRRTIGYARAWKASTLYVLNIFAYRSTNPDQLYLRGIDPVGVDNDREILRVTKLAAEAPWSTIVCAWGVHGALYNRGQIVREMLIEAGHQPTHLKLTKEGHPAHPLYQRADLKPLPWSSP